jgi:hypothetical protein
MHRRGGGLPGHRLIVGFGIHHPTPDGRAHDHRPQPPLRDPRAHRGVQRAHPSGSQRRSCQPAARGATASKRDGRREQRYGRDDRDRRRVPRSAHPAADRREAGAEDTTPRGALIPASVSFVDCAAGRPALRRPVSMPTGVASFAVARARRSRSPPVPPGGRRSLAGAAVINPARAAD